MPMVEVVGFVLVLVVVMMVMVVVIVMVAEVMMMMLVIMMIIIMIMLAMFSLLSPVRSFVSGLFSRFTHTDNHITFWARRIHTRTQSLTDF